MRKVNYTKTNTIGRKSRKPMFVALSVILLLIVFFLSFIVAYKLMVNGKNPDQQTPKVEQSVIEAENTKLKEQAKALELEIDELSAQVEKYKAIAGASSVATPKPSVKPTATPKPSVKPTQTPQTTATPEPKATATTEVKATPAVKATPGATNAQ